MLLRHYNFTAQSFLLTSVDAVRPIVLHEYLRTLAFPAKRQIKRLELALEQKKKKKKRTFNRREKEREIEIINRL